MTPWSSASRTRIIAGTSSVTVVPSPGRGVARSSVPPACATRSSSSESPTWPSLAAARALGGVEAAAVVGDDEPASGRRRPRDDDAHALGVRAAHVAQRLARDAVDERVGGGPPSARRRATSRCPAARSGLSRSSRTRLAGRRTPGAAGGSRPAACAGRARPGAACRRHSRSTRASSSSPRRRASAASGASPNATPARSCTTPSCRSAAIRRRSRSEASIALASSRSRSRVAALQAARQRPRQRHLEEQQHEQAAEQRRRERAAAAARALALTELKRW